MVAIQQILVFYQILVVGCVETLRSSPDKITVAASIREPFVVFDTQKKTLKGSDVTMLKEFGKKINIPVELIKLDINLIESLNSKYSFERFIQNENNS